MRERGFFGNYASFPGKRGGRILFQIYKKRLDKPGICGYNSEAVLRKEGGIRGCAGIGRQASLRCWCFSDVWVQVPSAAPFFPCGSSSPSGMCASGGIGRLARFRFWCPLRTCGFKSRLAHQMESPVSQWIRDFPRVEQSLQFVPRCHTFPIDCYPVTIMFCESAFSIGAKRLLRENSFIDEQIQEEFS